MERNKERIKMRLQRRKSKGMEDAREEIGRRKECGDIEEGGERNTKMQRRG